MKNSDVLDLVSLTTKVLTDTLPERFFRGDVCVIPVYGFTQTNDNRLSVIETAYSLYTRNPSRFRLSLLRDSDASNTGYSGYESWEAAASRAGFPLGAILPPVVLRHPLNTLSEAVALVNHAVLEGWLDLVIVAPPFHMVRAFMSVVTAIWNSEQCGARDINVYCAVGATLPWGERVAHSQGTLRETRTGLIGTELERVLRYQDPEQSKPVPLVTFAQCLGYLDRRGD